MDLRHLKQRLQDAKVRPAMPSRGPFMPRQSLSEVLTLQNVAEVVQDPIFRIPPHKWDDTARIVVEEGKEVFAILLEISCEAHLSTFIENECLSLPADFAVLSVMMPQSDARLFERIQSDYLVYSFHKGVWRRKVQDYETLPYVSEERIGGGCFSTVYRVHIHHSHQHIVQGTQKQVSRRRIGTFNFVSRCSQHVTLVRKELKPLQQDEKAEAELLFLFGSQRHPNIVELLTAYVHHNITNLLFHPADLDLHQLLERSDRPKAFDQDHLFFYAMEGLASGLAYLHNYFPRGQQAQGESSRSIYGYHHDIKPRNILIRGSEFILADFGLSRLKQIDEDSKTVWKNGTFEYGAPECRDPLSFEPGIVGRAIDIWSLGCVGAEVAAYMYKGALGVTEFREKRTVEGEYGKIRCFHDGHTLSSNVDDYFQTIEKTGTSRSIRRLMFRVRMAMAESAGCRPHAEQLETEFSRIKIEALFDDLIRLIEEKRELGDPGIEHNLFQALLLVEQHRLQAWAMSLGFAPGHDQESKQDRPVGGLMSSFYTTLRSVYDEVASPRLFDTMKDSWDSRLTVLRQANNELVKSLSDVARLSIDSIFFILTTHQKEEQCLQQSEALSEVYGQANDESTIAAMKYMSLKFGGQANENVSSSRIDSALMSPDPSKFENKVRPQIWFYSYGHLPGEERSTLVEFVPYWKQTGHISNSRSEEFKIIVEVMFTRVQELVSLLRIAPKTPGFRALDCLGAFHDHKRRRFGLVYAFPSKGNLPIRLNNIMRHGNASVIYPDPGEKLALAKSLIVCVQSFHTSGWIHKSISSFNVLFFLSGENQWDTIDLNEPYVIGFDHSRKDGQKEYSKGADQSSLSKEYLHPDYRVGSARAKLSFDYYSLGLLLLEIGLWMPISNVYGHAQHRTSSPAVLREEYIRLCEKQLKMVMGSRYSAVTKKCLQYGSGSNELEEQVGFQNSVVDELNKYDF